MLGLCQFHTCHTSQPHEGTVSHDDRDELGQHCLTLARPSSIFDEAEGRRGGLPTSGLRLASWLGARTSGLRNEYSLCLEERVTRRRGGRTVGTTVEDVDLLDLDVRPLVVLYGRP